MEGSLVGDCTKDKAVELIEDALAGRHLHESQTVEDAADDIKRFMVLSVNTRDHHEFFIDGFGETPEEALGVALSVDTEWDLMGIYDLLPVLLGGESIELQIQRGMRLVTDDKTSVGEAVWEK